MSFGKLTFVVDKRDGDLDLIPDDFFERYAVPVGKWLSTPHLLSGAYENADASDLAARCDGYQRAYKMFLAAAEKNKDGLRHEPHILANYNSVENSVVFTFIFKCENNGNTYRISGLWDGIP